MNAIQPKEKEQILIKKRKRKKRRAVRRLIFMLLCTVAALSVTGLINLEKVYNKALRDDDFQSAASGDQSQVKGDTTEVKDSQSAVNDYPSKSNWHLILVNYKNTIPDDYSVSLIQLKNEQAVDERIYPELQDMIDAARGEGIFPLISSSYRTTQMQETLYSEKVEEYRSNGYLNDKAEQLAQMWVALPGTSEHQIGLAVDIGIDHSQIIEGTQSSSDVHQWLMANSYKYGFILRYPEGKTDITGVNYEPWHYRYVGKDVAKEITEKGICLEEYLEALFQ